MPKPNDLWFDAASALSVGAREHQEDALIADFPLGSDLGMVVLSDGMGGHAAGDVASKIVMTEVFCELKFQSGTAEVLAEDATGVLRGAADAANDCLAAHITHNPDARGMGATLVAALFQSDRLNWISIGDSPLYLYRDGVLRQLNEDHSMAPQIDLMANNGLIDSDAARDHPDRNALTSVLSGNEIAKIDCPGEPFELRVGDIVIAASDGLQFVDDRRIASVLAEHRTESSTSITRALLREVEALEDPDQDNISIAVIRIESDEAHDNVADAVKSAFDFAQAFEAPADEDEQEEEHPEPVAVEDEAEAEEIPPTVELSFDEALALIMEESSEEDDPEAFQADEAKEEPKTAGDDATGDAAEEATPEGDVEDLVAAADAEEETDETAEATEEAEATKPPLGPPPMLRAPVPEPAAMDPEDEAPESGEVIELELQVSGDAEDIVEETPDPVTDDATDEVEAVEAESADDSDTLEVEASVPEDDAEPAEEAPESEQEDQTAAELHDAITEYDPEPRQEQEDDAARDEAAAGAAVQLRTEHAAGKLPVRRVIVEASR